VPRSRSPNRAQFALELERPIQPPVITGNLGALADLLLAALGAETMATREDDDERQDHV